MSKVKTLTYQYGRRVCYNYQSREISLDVTEELEEGDDMNEVLTNLRKRVRAIVDWDARLAHKELRVEAKSDTNS